MRTRISLTLAALAFAVGALFISEMDRGVAAQQAPIDLGFGELIFDPAELTAAPGLVTFNLNNLDNLRHNIVVDVAGTAMESEMLGGGATGVFEITIHEPGTYDFWCSVTNHRERGMVGRLTIQ